MTHVPTRRLRGSRERLASSLAVMGRLPFRTENTSSSSFVVLSDHEAKAELM